MLWCIRICMRIEMPKPIRQNQLLDLAAPATRIPVLPANRALLRFLRSAELEAWESAQPTNPGAGVSNSRASSKCPRGDFRPT